MKKEYRRKTHCKRGHLYTDETSRIRMQNGTIQRGCRTCESILAKLKYRNPEYRTPRTHCNSGHPFPSDSVPGNKRKCLVCRRAKAKERSLEKRGPGRPWNKLKLTPRVGVVRAAPKPKKRQLIPYAGSERRLGSPVAQFQFSPKAPERMGVYDG